jgi:hypothetical protein
MADNEIPILVTADSSQAKEQLEKAGDSVQMLSDLIGVTVPAGVTKMLASCELIAPALDAAFAPLAIISLGMALIDVTDKVSKFVADAVTGASSMSKFTDQIKSDNKVLEDLAQKTKAANRELALLNAPDQKSKNALKLQFQIEDQGGSAAQFKQQLEQKQQELKKLMTDTTTVAIDNQAAGITSYEQTLVSETEEGAQQIEKLKSEIIILAKEQGAAAAAEAVTHKQNQLALDQEASKTAALAAQKAAAAAQEKARRDADAAVAQKFVDGVLQNHNKILTAKQLEEEATKDQITAEQAIALSGLANVKVDEQRAQFAQKHGENLEKIAQLNRDITDKQAQHNAALQIALGYTTQLKADSQALAILEKDKSAAITESNSRLIAQQAIVKQLGTDTMDGMLGSPAQKAAYQKALLDFQKLKIEELNLEKKYDDQITGLQLRLANTSAAQIRKQMLDWQNLYKEMTNQFMSSLNSMNQSLVSFVVTGKGNWKNLASSAIESMLSMVLKYEESKAIMEILDALGLSKKKIANAAEAHSSASTASANTLADLPYPFNIPAAAQVLSIGDGLAVEAISSAGGDWRVDRDRLNFVHANETILPAGIAGKLRNMVESGSNGGQTVVVNHTVQAVDASSFQQHIRRHSNMIANEVTRALKRKRA